MPRRTVGKALRSRPRWFHCLLAAFLCSLASCEDGILDIEREVPADPGTSALLVAGKSLIPGAGVDDDAIDDVTDNCPATYNPDQVDTDTDGIGDACEVVFQAPSPRLTVTTQAELDALAGTTDLNGFLYVFGSQVTDLSPLSDLREVDLLILDNVGTSDMGPLSGIRRVTESLALVRISNFPATLSGLQGLELVNGLTLADIDGPSDLSELAGLVALSSLTVLRTNVAALTGIEALQLDSIRLGGNQLQSLDGLDVSRLTKIRLGDTQGSSPMSDLSALSGVTGAIEALELRNLPSAIVPALPGIASIQFLRLDQVPLPDLVPFQGIDVHTLSLASLPWSDLSEVARPSGVTNLNLSDFDLSSLAGLDAVSSIEVVTLYDLPFLQDLTALQNKALRILNLNFTPSLTTLASMGAQPSLYALYVHDAPLVDLVGLSSSPVSTLSLRGTSLTDLADFSGRSGSFRLTLDSNPALTSLDGIQGYVALDLVLRNNPALTNCAALVPLWNSPSRDATPLIQSNATGCNSVAEVLASVPDISGLTDPILFTSTRDGNTEIYAMSADGSSPVRLTNDPGSDSQPRWSPDRTRVAFVSTRDGNAEIYVLDLTNFSLTNVTQDPANDRYGAWSPDGTRLAFSSTRNSPGHFRVFVAAADGSGVTAVSPGQGNTPSWSPDGSQLAFSSHETSDLNTEVFVIGVDGSGLRQVTDLAGSSQRPAWSPDGTRIAFDSNQLSSSNPELYVVNVDGTGLTQLTSSPTNDVAAAWSSDASRIAFQSRRSGNYEIYSVASDGTDLQRLTTDSATDVDPSWTAWDFVPAFDSDGDGVPDSADVCPGFDDALDGDGDGTPDGCDPIYNGDLTIATQADLDTWSTLTQVTGRLNLQGTDISDLTSLSALNEVDVLFLYQTTVGDLSPLSGLTRARFLHLRENPNLTDLQGLDPNLSITGIDLQSNANLTSLDGFPNLTRLFGIALNNNPVLQDVSALSGLTQLDGYLRISGSGSLTTLTGLEGLTEAKDLTLVDLHGLTDLSGLDSFSQGSVQLSNNSSLQSLSPMGPLTSALQLEIRSNPVLTDVSALAGVTGLTRSLIIWDNDALVDLTPLAGLTSVGQDFLIRGNDAMTELTGLENLGSVGNRFYLEDNTTLGDCSAVRDVIQNGVGGQLYISGNATGCASYGEIVIGIDADGDGVPDTQDVCPGHDDTIDTDGDGVPDGCDAAPNDPTGGTPVGTDVVVDPNDQSGSPSGVMLDFDAVTGGGESSVTTSQGGPPPPGGFRLGSPPVYYDINTTASFAGTVTVCIDYSGQSFANENNLRLMHEDEATGTWDDITTSLDTASDLICGETTSFSYFIVSEPNQPPALDLGGPYTTTEGASAALTMIATDSENDPLTFTWDLGDGTSGTGATLPTDHTYADDGTYTVSVTADDGSESVTETVSVQVANATPVITSLIAPVEPLPVLASAQLDVTYTDAGVLDSHVVDVDWGDGTITQASIAPGVGGGSATDSHLYSGPGVYTVQVTVTDDDGGTGTGATTEYVVVYDGEAGFVTGGGWITSPLGAYLADTSLSGKASFGFVSRYQNGANVPTGNTQFKFKTASFDFRSTEYQWLVVAGAKAQFKGIGAVNGAGSYSFLLTGRDSDLPGGGAEDSFRIKIWDEATGAVVYDNKIGLADDSDDATELGGGQIVVHKQGGGGNQ